MKTIQTTTFCLFTMTAFACVCPAQTRLVEKEAGFAYTAPTGWKVASNPASKFKISYATPHNGFASNINVVLETAPVGMAEYVKAALANAKKQFTSLKVLSQTPFTTTSGIKGMRAVSNNAVQGRQLRQVFYIFPGTSDRKYTFVCTALVQEGSKLTSAFDKAAKSFTLQ